MRDDQTIHPNADTTCVCGPGAAEDPEAISSACDVHGTPSTAFKLGYEMGLADRRPFNRTQNWGDHPNPRAVQADLAEHLETRGEGA